MTAALDGLTTLAVVRDFLTERVAPAVSEELAGELRAAVKLLDTVRIELNERHPSLRAEIADLLGYADRLATLLGEEPRLEQCRALAEHADTGALRLHDLEDIRRRTRELSSQLLVDVRRFQDDAATSAPARHEAGDLHAEFCACLGAHARARLSWQVVFPDRVGTPCPGGDT